MSVCHLWCYKHIIAPVPRVWVSTLCLIWSLLCSAERWNEVYFVLSCFTIISRTELFRKYEHFFGTDIANGALSFSNALVYWRNHPRRCNDPVIDPSTLLSSQQQHRYRLNGASVNVKFSFSNYYATTCFILSSHILSCIYTCHPKISI